MRPADIARRARELADKREKSAATTSAPHVREQLLATARNYRALAVELERKVHANSVVSGHTADYMPREISRIEAPDYRSASGQNKAISGTPSTTTRTDSGNPRRQ